MSAALRVHRVPFSTNVERVAIAAAHKGLAVEWVDHDPTDRSAIVALSGQPLVPVLEAPDGTVLADSPAILRWLDERHPEPPLWPADPAARARADVFTAWFNGVWKVAPNALAEEPDGPDAPRHEAALAAGRAIVEGLLHDGPYLLGDALTVADVTAYPFLRYGVAPVDPDDTDPFHAVLRRHVAVGPELPRTRDWLVRMASLPQA